MIILQAFMFTKISIVKDNLRQILLAVSCLTDLIRYVLIKPLSLCACVCIETDGFGEVMYLMMYCLIWEQFVMERKHN